MGTGILFYFASYLKTTKVIMPLLYWLTRDALQMSGGNWENVIFHTPFLNKVYRL